MVLGSVHGQSGSVAVGNNLVQMAKPSDRAGKSIKAFLQYVGKQAFDAKAAAFPPHVEQAAFDTFLVAA